jgi:hypothetical protein
LSEALDCFPISRMEDTMFLFVRILVWFVVGSATLSLIEKHPVGAWVLGIVSTLLTAWLAIDLYEQWPHIREVLFQHNTYDNTYTR